MTRKIMRHQGKRRKVFVKKIVTIKKIKKINIFKNILK
jgi:hypothetical protein